VINKRLAGENCSEVLLSTEGSCCGNFSILGDAEKWIHSQSLHLTFPSNNRPGAEPNKSSSPSISGWSKLVGGSRFDVRRMQSFTRRSRKSMHHEQTPMSCQMDSNQYVSGFHWGRNVETPPSLYTPSRCRALLKEPWHAIMEQMSCAAFHLSVQSSRSIGELVLSARVLLKGQNVWIDL
jgi:hypothetical protein